ncbi:MAG: hypothetical protein QM808_04075 [Steroidobacteraceae bacterium]
MRLLQGKGQLGILMVLSLATAAAYAQFYERPLIQKGVTGTDQEPTGNRNQTGPAKIANPPVDRSADCNAKCLTDIADKYFAALVKRDFTGLPTAPNLLVAENSHATRIGAGVWKVLEKLNANRTYITDPVSGQVLALTTFEMSAKQPVIYITRFKIENRLIAEIESMVTQDLNAAQHFRPDNVATFDPVAMSVVPADRRATREQLLAMAGSMWTGRGEKVTAASNCMHWENADKLTRFRCGANEVAPIGPAHTHRNVRHTMVDTERGLVVTFALKDTAPSINSDPPDDERTPIFYQRPLTLYFLAINKYEAGNKLTTEHNFMNAQEANLSAVFVE